MTEGDWNLMQATIEGRLARAAEGRYSRHAMVSPSWLAGMLVDNERLRRRETELQADNTRLHLKAEVARTDAACMRDVVRLNGAEDVEKWRVCVQSALNILGGEIGENLATAAERVVREGIEMSEELAAETANANAYAHQRDEARAALEERKKSSAAAICELMQQRDEARALNGEMAAKLDRAKGDSDAASRTIGDLTRERDEAIKQRDGMLRRAAEAYPRCDRVLRPVLGECLADAAERVVRERNEATAALVAANASIAECRQALLDAQREMVSVTESRDALASSSVPVELARLFRAAVGARSKWGKTLQELKLSEECGEYVAEVMRGDNRRDAFRVAAEAHDVLTVALSLYEPALMAKAAERLEGRLK